MMDFPPAHLRAELEVANLVLYLPGGQREGTYAYTCCDGTVGTGELEQSLKPVLAGLFLAARGELTNQISNPAHGFDLFNVGCIHADGRSLNELMPLVVQTRANGGWAVLMIHGVGTGTHGLCLEAEVHDRFIGWLAQQRSVWTAPVRTIVR